jgi:signal transduction histidine kinase
LLIFKEAVRNILKHAQANRVEIRAALRQSDGSNCFLVLTLRDNGCGFDLSRPAAAGHHGLDNMRKRAAAVGGETLIQSAPGAGTFIEIAMPLARAQETNAPSHFKRSN